MGCYLSYPVREQGASSSRNIYCSLSIQFVHFTVYIFIISLFMALLRLCFLSSSHFSSSSLSFVPHNAAAAAAIQFPQFNFPHTLTLKPSIFLAPLSSSSSSSSIKVQSSIESSQLQTTNEIEDETSRTRLLAQNVPWTCSADDIRVLFEKYGNVLDVEFSMYNKNRNRGLVFVSMSSHQEAVAALTNLEAYEFEGRALRLSWAKPKKKTNPSPIPPKKPQPIHNLFVANLPFKATDNDLKDFFNTENANAVSAEIIFNDNPRQPAGYGFVSFNTKKEAEAALSAFEGKVFMGRTIRVARSKRFLRQGTKAQTKSEVSSSESNLDGEQSAKPSYVEA